MIYFEGERYHHRYDNCRLVQEARAAGKKEFRKPPPEKLPVCPYCNLMSNITPPASGIISSEASVLREELLDRAIDIAYKDGLETVTEEAVEKAKYEYFKEALSAR